MTTPPNAVRVVPGDADAARPVDVLYESASTRVARFADASPAGGLIYKEYLGARAAQRLGNEKDLLRRLAGVEGIIQLAPDVRGPDVLVMQDCGGVTLSRMLQSGKCDTGTLLSLACQLTRALAEVHRVGIIHCDIHPANVLVSSTRQAVLIDFDQAMLAAQQPAVESAGQILGTLSCIAPEQTGRTGRTVDQRADLYSLGATLYQMAVGRPPFVQADALQLIHDHLVREPVAPCDADPAVPRGLSNIIVRLLAKAPEQRYQSAEGLLYDLRRLCGELEGRSSVFELGEQDFGPRLAAPARLVGRDEELAVLRKAFVDAMHTSQRTVLIDGPVGVGKSALIDELRPLVAEAGGWFAYGKDDQYQKDSSTSGALTQALRALGRLLLTRSAEEVAAQRERILKALGRNARLITRTSPEFALLLGEHVDVPDVDPRQVELQLQQAMLDLLLAVATPASPLVVVVDDLQWAGAFSLRLFERILMDGALRGLLLVGSYRSEEVQANPVLARMLAHWQQHARPSQITLGNLGLPRLGELIGQMLRLSPVQATDLAADLSVLTGGNPFDTVEMINALRGDGVLKLGDSGWQWDKDKVRRFVGRGNVVDLLAARIARLPAASRELLESMSCLGGAVDFTRLRAAVGLSEEELQARLRAPLEDGLVVPDSTNGEDGVSFRHDRVQQALLAAMDDAQRARRQIAMARRLASGPGFEAEAAQQYLACVGLLDEPWEQRRVARLFHAVAQALASTATYSVAERYLAAADKLLAAIDEPGDAPLRRAIDVARHSALYSLGRVNEADPLFGRIQDYTKDALDLVQPSRLQLRSLLIRGRPGESLALGVRLLGQLGLHVPPGFDDPSRDQRLDALHEWVETERELDPLERAQIRDPRLLGISKLLTSMAASAYHCGDFNAVAWLLLESQRLWVEQGVCENLIGSVGSLDAVLIGPREDFRTAYDISRHVIAVGEALGFEGRTAAARNAFAWHTCPWFEPVENALSHAQRAFEVFQLKGDDAAFSCYLNVARYVFVLEIAPHIDHSLAEIDSGLVLCRRTGNSGAAALHLCERQMLRALRGQTTAPTSFDDKEFNEEAFVASLGESPRLHDALTHCHALHAVIWGKTDELVRHVPAPGTYPPKAFDRTRYGVMHGHLAIALARAWQLQQGVASTSEAALLMGDLESRLRWIERRAADQPYNFLHLLRLVEAEQAWAIGDMWKAARTFDEAVLEAEARQRPWHRALITERAGLFHLAGGLTGTGRTLLAKARDHYQAWGAIAKVDQMQREHAFLRSSGRSQDSPSDSRAGHSINSSQNVSSDMLDLVGVLRASQALSSETSLERLTARVSDVLASLSGATKVLLLSCNDGQWCLLSPAMAQVSMPVAQAAQQRLLPLSAFEYAQRTGEALVVEDAAVDDRFARDPYFAGVGVCSLLLVPINSHDSARAMLLLENRLGRAAFNAQRLDAVMLIAGQLAVSLANAQLYENLEQRVQARTRELQEAQDQLVTTARRAGMAEIANNVLHNVGNVLNSINVSASVLRGTLGNSKIDGLTRALDLVNQQGQDLPRFIESDPRGKALWPYLNQLAGALHAERQEALDNLGRLSQSVDHITYVMATQQAHSGPSSVREMAQPHEPVEEALRLSALHIQRGGIEIVRRYEDVPPSALDKQRLVQILVNLIGNAAHAMESMPASQRRITLGTSLVRVEDVDRLRVTVQDSGEGIAPENLTRIFAHGFTTRASGHGFGLHSSALAATEMGGKLSVHSDGPGRGSTFTIDLPLQ